MEEFANKNLLSAKWNVGQSYFMNLILNALFKNLSETLNLKYIYIYIYNSKAGLLNG